MAIAPDPRGVRPFAWWSWYATWQVDFSYD
jgi:hypothetical protein